MTSVLAQQKTLALYYYDSCPYCAKTKKAISRLGLKITMKNIQQNKQDRIELLQQGGKMQVPCLRIDNSKGKTQWLYESDDIIAYLSK